MFAHTHSEVFLDALDLKPNFSPKTVSALGKIYGFDKTENAEIRNRFYRIALKSGPEFAEQAAGECFFRLKLLRGWAQKLKCL